MGKKKLQPVEDILDLMDRFVVPPVEKIDKDALVEYSEEDLKKQLAELRKNADETFERVQTALSWMERTRDYQELPHITQGMAKARKYVDAMMSNEVAPYKAASIKAFFIFNFSREFQSAVEVGKRLDQMVIDGYLQQVKRADGKIFCMGKDYVVINPDNILCPKDEDEVVEAFRKLMEKITNLGRAQRREKSEVLREQSEITIPELLSGKSGMCALSFPAQVVPRENQEPKRKPGGVILVKSNGIDLYPIDSTVGYQNQEGKNEIQRAAEEGIFLHLSSLSYETPPWLKQQLGFDNAKLLQELWSQVKRGVMAFKEKEAMEPVLAEYAKKATISPEEFFLQGLNGICLVKLETDWHSADGERTPNVIFLVNRDINDEGSFISLVEYPDHLKEFFANCEGICKESGSKFDGVPQPLKAVLQSAFGMTTKIAKAQN